MTERPLGKTLGTWGGEFGAGERLPQFGDALSAIGQRGHDPRKPFRSNRVFRNPSTLREARDGSLTISVRFGGAGSVDVWAVEHDDNGLPRLVPTEEWGSAPFPYPVDDALAEVLRILGELGR
jgi:hypothetical protein